MKIGAATAKGLAFPNSTPCVAVSTLAALAYGADEDGLLCPVLDARRGMFYNALFQSCSGVVTRLTEDRQVSSDELVSQVRAYGQTVVLSGDGSPLLPLEGAVCKEPYVKAEDLIAVVLAGGGITCSPAELAPEYLRLPQAERERLERIKIDKGV